MTRDNPFDELRDVLDRFTEEIDTQPIGLEPSTPIDLKDRGEALVVTLDVPGFDPDEIDVTLADRTLRVAAEEERSTDEESAEYIRRERRRRSIDRSLTLPTEVDPEAVEATYTNGVLKITLPKTGEDGGTAIEIE